MAYSGQDRGRFMAWKQDLAKLKQQLGPEEPVPAAKPLPKPKPKGPTSLDEEDAVFLSAMGLKASAPRPPKPAEPAAPEVVPEPDKGAAPPPTPETFEAALKELKGLKPLPRGLQARPEPSARRAPAPDPQPLPEPPPAPPILSAAPIEPEPPAPAPAEPEPPAFQAAGEALLLPTRFQLAAGMALEVDGILDLRGHSRPDAVERLKDRLGDGQVLGWRSLQVILGSDPTLHEGLMDLLTSGQVPMVTRYAQAPVPMGGSQAWLLYLGPIQPLS